MASPSGTSRHLVSTASKSQAPVTNKAADLDASTINHELAMEFIQVEEQDLLEFLQPMQKMARHLNAKLESAETDLAASGQGSAAQNGLGDSLAHFKLALHELQSALRYCNSDEVRSSSAEFARLEAQLSTICKLRDNAASPTGSAGEIPSLDLGSPLLEKLGELRLNHHGKSMLVFDRNSPPSLADIKEWLGLDSDVTTAILLNAGPIQDTYDAFRAMPGKSCARNPEGLIANMALFTYSRDTLLDLQRRFKASQDALHYSRKDALNFSAAFFAHRVVRYLEGSSEVADWEPVSSNIKNLEDYEVARCHWAVALQIFWFMEKSFERSM